MFSYHQKKAILKNKYFILFLCFMGALILYPLIYGKPLALLAMHAFLVLSLINIAFVVERRSYLFKLDLLLAICLIVFSIIVVINPHEIASFVRSLMIFSFYIINIWILLKDITHKEEISKDILLGSLCVYIVIALLFAVIYNYIDFNYPHAFQFSVAKHDSELEKAFDIVYFSFTTLSTVGYGDIVPTSVSAKSIVVIEQITGIFYLAVLVSRLVTTSKKRRQ